jgi:hypothetical protein
VRLSLGLDHTTRPSWGGVAQRTHHFLYFIWQAVVAGRLAWAGEPIAASAARSDESVPASGDGR